MANIKAAADLEIARMTQQAQASIKVFKAGNKRDLAEHDARMQKTLTSGL